MTKIKGRMTGLVLAGMFVLVSPLTRRPLAVHGERKESLKRSESKTTNLSAWPRSSFLTLPEIC